jgi:hypothetical protein
MVTVVSFNKRVPPAAAGAGRGTLAELMAKSKAAADAKAAAMQPQETPTIMQGIGHLANVAASGFLQNRAEGRESASREELAKLQAGIGLGEASPEQIAELGRYDPQLAQQYREEAMAARVRADELKQKDLEYQRSKADEAAINARETGETIASEGRAAQRESNIDVREQGQTIATEGRAATRESDINARELEEAKAAEGRAKALEQEQHTRDLAEGKIRILTPEEAKAQNLDPTRQWATDAAGTKLTDVTPDPKVTYTYRPMTPEEQAKYGVPSNQPAKMKVGTDGSAEPISIGGVQPPVASEVAARVALMKDFLEKFPDVTAQIDAGALTGPGYLYGVVGGYGEGGKVNRVIQSGSEALVRNLTGAGMPQSEAERYVTRYEPGALDTAAKLKDKVLKLRTDLLNVREGVIAGHTWDQIIDPALLEAEPPPPTAAPAEAPAAAPADANAKPKKRVLSVTRVK